MARVTMIWWDKRFLSHAAANDVTLCFYMRYVDDQNTAGKPLEAGRRWEVGPWASGLGGRMVYKKDRVLKDLETPEDKRTMRDLQKMGNSVSSLIQLEEDYPSKNSDGKLPILDLKVWVKEVMEEEGDLDPVKAQLYYQYYRKPISNWLLMPAISAMPGSVKRAALTQYGLRILRNTKLEVEWCQKAAMLSEFMERMRDSGYSHRFWQEILESILKGWDSIVEEHLAGRRPINRPRSWKQHERQETKWRKRTSWFKSG